MPFDACINCLSAVLRSGDFIAGHENKKLVCRNERKKNQGRSVGVLFVFVLFFVFSFFLNFFLSFFVRV